MVARMMLFGAILAAGCASAPKTQGQRMDLENAADAAISAMLNRDPSLRGLMDQSAGYIVFPEVKEGGFIVGGAGARGVVFENGVATGFASLRRVSAGALAGGERYAEMVVIRDRQTLDRVKSGELDLSGQASATILKSGAAAATNFGHTGVAVVINPIRGAMVNLSIAGQRIRTTRM